MTAAPTAARPASRGRRARGLRDVFESTCDASPNVVALECGDTSLSYAELDTRANRLAHRLAAAGVRPGARVGIRLHRSVRSYVALLAVVKAGAVFVPIDMSAPAERVAFIAQDAALAAVLGEDDDLDPALPCPVLSATAGSGFPAWRPDRDQGADPAAYVIYTSGSTGSPKGVEVAQSSIVNFLEVVAPIYRVVAGDRVYQGMTLAFDFSIEEIWPAWAAGATLIAGPADDRRFGAGLAEFLAERRITVLCCVPTVLATLEPSLPALRTLIVGGEPCPAELVHRWSRPGLRMLNTYGPTETTVTATWAELSPERAVTIGRPLPTYGVEVLDGNLHPMPAGETGEICVSGPGVARGYVNQPRLTAERFRRGPGGQRVYRTGDLGRALPNGELEFLGRADSEVKLRGHRVDLQEIESLLLADPAVTAAAARLLPDGAALAAYVTTAGPADGLVARLHAALRQQLPGYMVPSHLEVLATLPTLPSGKIDRAALPEPCGPRVVAHATTRVAPSTPTERQIAREWGEVLDLAPQDVSAQADFFTDLGGHSLLATTVISRLRSTGLAPGLSVAALYAHPTIRALAAHVDQHTNAPAAARAVLRHRARRVAVAGLAQAGAHLGLLLVLGAPVAVWMAAHGAGTSTATLLWQGALVAAASLLPARLLVPIAGVRLLTTGLRPGRYPLWGGTYLRVWLAGRLLALAPLATLSGSPLLGPYLRALGARVGPRCHLATGAFTLPRFTDIGAGTSIGYGVRLETTQVDDGWLTVGPVRVGAGAFVGAGAVLGPGTRIDHGGQLAEHSLLPAGQTVPTGRRWAGSPAGPAEPDTVLAAVERRPAAADRWSRPLLAGFVASWLVAELLPVAAAVPGLLLVCRALAAGTGVLAAVLASGPLFVLTTCLLVLTGKRLVLPHTPTGMRPLRSALGLRKYLSDQLLDASLAYTGTLYATLYTVGWLRLLGARIGPRSEVSTAAHVDPDLLWLDEECFVADQAMLGPATYHRGHVVLARSTLRRRSFLGNAALARSGTTLGAASLVGAHSLAPPTGTPPGTSWVGSPPIRLPSRQDSPEVAERLTFRPTPARVAGRLAIELVRVLLPATLLAVALLGGFRTLLAVARGCGTTAAVLTAPLILAAAGLGVVLTVAGLKWTIVGRYRPRVAPLWDTYVRRTELITGLYETAAVPALLGMLAGTPILPALLRLFGTHIGSRVWLATTYLTEFDLVHIGHHAAIGSATSLQTHLFEDRVMKMSTVTIAPAASVGPRTVVLYDAVLGTGTRLDALSLAMKGEHLASDTHWRGIPAQPAEPGRPVT